MSAGCWAGHSVDLLLHSRLIFVELCSSEKFEEDKERIQKLKVRTLEAMLHVTALTSFAL